MICIDALYYELFAPQELPKLGRLELRLGGNCRSSGAGPLHHELKNAAGNPRSFQDLCCFGRGNMVVIMIRGLWHMLGRFCRFEDVKDCNILQLYQKLYPVCMETCHVFFLIVLVLACVGSIKQTWNLGL